ncbi:hypothetical protein BPAE_0398g00060 [Botrytis paeoniae]|uniref:Uncharacterized protein n=1 Tax=Botrytis paeoniae TaxID=278948 RepID=A0A4Z1F5E1_9HELO|nr:hypothetical protein BPAE_0398g00060 [Botrytis paeoniae]
MSSPLYSQASNFGSFIQKGVDPRTGQYTCTIDIFSTPTRTRNCSPFKLSLTFNPMNMQDNGFGQGWSLSLPAYEHRQASPTVILSTGESFQCTETSSTMFVNDQKLRSSQIEKLSDDTYQITYKSGQIEILSNCNDTYNKSVLTKVYANTGRSLSFSWNTFGEQPRLDKIQQGSDVLFQIDYGDSQVNITRAPNTPEASTFTLTLGNGQLQELSLPIKDKPSWEFTYQTYDPMVYLTSVTSPTGLVEEMNYKEQGHSLPTGAPYQTIPYVISYASRPGNGQPAITTTYSYSDRNFLAYDGDIDWRDGEDTLYLTPDDYQYSSTVQVEGGTLTTYTYDKYHLLITSKQQKEGKSVTKSITYFAIPSSGFDDQPPQYQLPKSIETTYEDTDSQATRKEISSHTFDEWGNPTQDIQPNGITTDRTYYAPGGEDGCPADPSGFQRYMKTETVTPADSDYSTPTRIESYTYTQLPTATDGVASHFVAVQQRQTLEASQVLTTTDYAYVQEPSASDHSRISQQVTQLFGKYPTTKSWTYTYPDGQFKQALTTLTFDGIKTKEETSYSLWTGLPSSRTNEADITNSFSYNTIGQLTKAVNSLDTPCEAVLQIEYTYLGTGNGAQRTVTDAKGLKTCYTTDGLERIYRVEKQDDYTKDFRLIRENSYNAQGQQITMDEIDWMRTDDQGTSTKQRSSRSLEYDDWGNTSKVTENKLVTLFTEDPITMTKTEGIEGEGTVKTTSNIFGDPTEISLYFANSTLYSSATYSYDGLGRLVSQADQSGSTTSYGVDSFDRIIKTSFPNSRVVKIAYASQTTASLPVSVQLNNATVGEQSYDGLGRLTGRTVGLRNTSQSYEGVSPEPAQIISAAGEQHNLTYEPALNYAPMTMTSGQTSGDNTDTYQYDSQSAAPSQFKNSQSIVNLSYRDSGLISKERIQRRGGQDLFTQYTFSMNGKMQQYTDVNGKKLEVQYDEFGRALCLIQDQLKVAFVYDNAGRVVQNSVSDETSSSSLSTTLTYDDFGREVGRSVYKGETTLLYNLSQTYTQTGLVNSRSQEDSQGVVLRGETFEYDVDNRLITYLCQGSLAPIDQIGRHLQLQSFTFNDYNNVVQMSTTFHDGTQNSTSYTFNAQDPTQLISITNTHPDYPANVDLEYDQNGCLTKDEQGRTLEYDDKSRLSTVRDNNSQIITQYLYDATGKLVCQQVPGQSDTNLFYRDSLVAVTKGDQKISYLSHESTYWAETISSASDRADAEAERTNLWASDGQKSILTALNTQQSDQIINQQYTPYCFSNFDATSPSSSSIGFNGQWRDPVTGWYHLGNGYRVYNPVLMRFHTPDPGSPFTSGEVNPYVYCLGDPINRIDPTGHFSLFGFLKTLFQAIIGMLVSIAVAVLTAGASLAIEIGVGIVAGVASDVTTGALGDLAGGHKPTWKSVGLDALGGLAGGIGGGIGGELLKGGIETLKAAPIAIKTVLGRAGSYAVTKPLTSAIGTELSEVIKSAMKGVAREFIPAEVASEVTTHFASGEWPEKKESGSNQESQKLTSSGGSRGPKNPLGRRGPTQIGSHSFYLNKGSSKARDMIRPAMKDGGQDVLTSILNATQVSSSFRRADVGGGQVGHGQAGVAALLNRDGRFSFGPLAKGGYDDDNN